MGQLMQRLFCSPGCCAETNVERSLRAAYATLTAFTQNAQSGSRNEVFTFSRIEPRRRRRSEKEGARVRVSRSVDSLARLDGRNHDQVRRQIARRFKRCIAFFASRQILVRFSGSRVAPRFW